MKGMDQVSLIGFTVDQQVSNIRFLIFGMAWTGTVRSVQEFENEVGINFAEHLVQFPLHSHLQHWLQFIVPIQCKSVADVSLALNPDCIEDQESLFVEVFKMRNPNTSSDDLSTVFDRMKLYLGKN